MSNEIEVLVFDNAGIDPVQIEPDILSVEWLLNKTGRAQCYMSYSDDKCTPDNLAFGNRILFRFENGLPPLGGVIDIPRTRMSTGVTFNVYGGSRILEWRHTPSTRAFSSTVPGTIFQTLIEEETAQWDSGFVIGSIYTDGTARNETYHYDNVLEIIQQLAKDSGEDFEIVPVYQSGRLTFLANWQESLGSDISDNVLLVEDRNISPPKLDEQGTIANRVILIGSADGTLAWKERPFSIDTDITSRNAYGYREYAKVALGIRDQTTLDANVGVLATEMNTPREHYTVEALDKDPAGFGEYGVGDTVTLQAFLIDPDWAIDTTVRIMGRKWTLGNVCRLEVK